MYALPKRPVTESPLYSTTYIVKAPKATSNLPRRLSLMPRNALGRGLSALIREPEPAVAPPPPQPQREPVPAAQPARPTSVGTMAAATAAAPAPSEGLFQADIDLIDPSPYQPRTRFREEALDELARSIHSSGIVQPLVVRRIANRFQLIAGERRWRAAQRAGLLRVPVV